MMTPPPIEVANLGMWDSLILMVMALVVFGPRRLPEIARKIGKIMYEVRKASNDFKFQMEEELRNAEEADRRKKEEERRSAMALTAPAEAAPVSPVQQEASAPPAESPYPDGVIYPPVAAAAPETPAEEPYPRIQPPSTGEPVPAARPGKRAALPKAPAAEKAVRAAKVKPAADKVPARVKKTRKEPGSDHA
jgi:sec-independent protein translocase protein TatB